MKLNHSRASCQRHELHSHPEWSFAEMAPAGLDGRTFRSAQVSPLDQELSIISRL